MNPSRLFTLASACALALLVSSCGGGSDDPTGPSGGGGGGGGGGSAAATITIKSAGVSPKNVTVAAGSRVTFVNNDSRPHTMNSDPHPDHTDCPEINAVGFIAAGASGTTQNLNTRRVCGFHDHEQFLVTSLQGTITI